MDIGKLITKAWADREFKAALLRDPKSTIEGELGVVLPSGVNIQVHEQTETDIHLVLPSPR